jgi:hypothetical protein
MGLMDDIVQNIAMSNAKDLLEKMKGNDYIEDQEIINLKMEVLLKVVKKRVVSVEKEVNVSFDRMLIKAQKENDEEKLANLKTSALKDKAISDYLAKNKAYQEDLEFYENLKLLHKMGLIQLEAMKRDFKLTIPIAKIEGEKLAQSLKNGIINGGPVTIGKFEGTLEEFEEFKQEIYKRKSGQKDKTETSYIQ